MTQKKHPIHRIALVGFGTVARGLIQILSEQRERLLKSDQFEFEVVAVSTRSRGTMYDPQGLSLELLTRLGQANTPFESHLIDWDADAMIRQSNATVIVELAHTDLITAEPALTHCRAAFETGKHLITGNKGPAALAYSEMKSLSDQNGCAFLNEATVLSGTPVFSFRKHALQGNKILAAKGILNGTTNFILSEMETGSSYEDALNLADSRGYLEADKAADVEGYDAQAKLAILANVLLEIPVELSHVSRKGITHITKEMIQEAKQQGKRWKLIASLKAEAGQVTATVQPEALSLSDPLSQISGTLNAITFTTDLLGDITITGPGAGSLETGYGILSDLLTLNKGELS